MFEQDFIRSFLTGATSGTISAFLFQPLDVLKTQIQDQRRLSKNAPVTYFLVFRNILQSQGPAGFWKGLTPALARCIPGVGLYFSSLNLMTTHVIGDTPSVLETVFLGAAARASSTIIFIPFTVIKTRFESGQYKYTGLFDAVRSIKQFEGVQGFTRGLVPTLIRDVPFSGLYYLFYTRTKTLLGLEQGESNSYKVFLSGVIAGCSASFITHPADLIKTYVQLYPNEFNKFSSGIYFIYKRFGFKGYFNGLMIRLMRRTLVTSMSWTVYEKINIYVKVPS
ncbi:mitochondrial glycine transporter A-like [Planococcus citri]|uniref:mitochondrial glycine transporter A-like n=1 Tax=Planococcus citri TaxID=170843 RepID=UPI0031F76E5A